MDKKTAVKRVRFSCQDDIDLLKETLAVNPYEDTKLWKIVHYKFTKITKKEFSLRAVKEHVEYLISLFKKKDLGNLRRSGTEEMYGAKEQLLQELVCLQDEWKGKNSKRTKAVGEQMRSQAASCLSAEDDDSFVLDVQETEAASSSSLPTAAVDENNIASSSNGTFAPRNVTRAPRGKKRSIAEMLQEKYEGERAIENRKLDIEEKKLALEQRRLDLEERKFEAMAVVQQQQTQLLSLLIEKLTK